MHDGGNESSDAEELAGYDAFNRSEVTSLQGLVVSTTAEIDQLVADLEKLGYLPIMKPKPRAASVSHASHALQRGRSPTVVRKEKCLSPGARPIHQNQWNQPDKRILGRRMQAAPPDKYKGRTKPIW
jgi:hypothetical protein